MIQNLELQVLMSKILCNQPPQFYCFVPSTALGSRERWREQRTRKERGEDREVEGKRGETHREGGREREKREGEDREVEGKRGETHREGGREREKREGEDREVEGKRGETHTEGGKEREKRKGEDREMEGRTPYTVMSKHILKGNEWVTYLLFMRI